MVNIAPDDEKTLITFQTPCPHCLTSEEAYRAVLMLSTACLSPLLDPSGAIPARFLGPHQPFFPLTNFTFGVFCNKYQNHEMLLNSYMDLYQVNLTLSQTNLCFYASHSEAQVFLKHCGIRRNCSLPATSPFPTMFSNLLENFLQTSNCRLQTLSVCMSDSFLPTDKFSKLDILTVLTLSRTTNYGLFQTQRYCRLQFQVQ